MRILFKVNPGIGFSSFSLGHHIFNSEGVLKRTDINRRLNSFTLRLLVWRRNPHITLFFLFEPLLGFQSPVNGLGWWEVAREEEGEGLWEEEEQLDPLWYLLDSILCLLSSDRSQHGLLPDQGLRSMFQRNSPANYRHLRCQLCLRLH